MNQRKPNILFILADDQRFDTIHVLGNPAIQTPNLDKLANCGCVFENAHIPGGTSGAVCMPSRAMIHTGRSLFHLDGAGAEIPQNHKLLGEHLKEYGYQTFGTGKWHNGITAFNRSFEDGDEIFFGGMADHWNVPAHHYDKTGKYENFLPSVRDPLKSNEVDYRHADHIHVGRHSSETICDATAAFIRNHDRNRPFFAYTSFLAPHDPRVMPEEYRKMYEPKEIELPPNFMGGHPFDTGAINIRDEMLAGFPRTPEEVKRHIAEYYAMITHLDAQLGRLMDELETAGVLENTIIVFAADNGLAVGQHGLMGKQSCYEHSVRVPLIFAGPGIPKNTKTQANVYLFDIFPTTCELIGASTPESVDGVSLVKAMNDTDETIRNSMYFAYTDSQRAVKKNGYKLIEYAVPDRTRMTQLFYLEKNQWELENLVDDEKSAPIVAELRKEMIRHRDDWDDLASKWGEGFWNRCMDVIS